MVSLQCVFSGVLAQDFSFGEEDRKLDVTHDETRAVFKRNFGQMNNNRCKETCRRIFFSFSFREDLVIGFLICKSAPAQILLEKQAERRSTRTSVQVSNANFLFNLKVFQACNSHLLLQDL